MNAYGVVPALDLERFDISRETGFLPAHPLEQLPVECAILDDCALRLPRLIESGPGVLRRELDKFPILHVGYLEGGALRRAMMIYSFLASAQVQSGSKASFIPKGIAIPLHVLSTKFSVPSFREEQYIQKPPILSYVSYALDNWRLKDSHQPFEIENLENLINFSNDPNEPGFILPHVAIEARAGFGLEAIGRAQAAVLNDNAVYVEDGLWRMASALHAMYGELIKMPLWCDPEHYYKTVRPWIQMFDHIVYEGVNDFHNEGQTFRGETGAQSSIVPSLLAALGIEHKNTMLTQHLEIMLSYMPPLHRQFIEAVKRGPSIRSYVLQKHASHPPLKEAYNTTLEMLIRFRKKHLSYAHSYITERNAGATGTGGTPFAFWLSQLIIETEEHFV